MKSNYFLRVIIFFILLLFCFSARADALTVEEARYFSETTGKELLQTFSQKDQEEKYKKIDEMFVKDVDLDYISRFVIGKYWRNMNSEQQKKYQQLFTQYALNAYKNFPLSFNEDNLNYKIMDVQVKNQEAYVRTEINYLKNQEETNKFQIEFRMHKKNGKIMLTDIKAGESSLLLSYRNRFYQMMREADEEIDWFLEDFALLVSSNKKHLEDGIVL